MNILITGAHTKEAFIASNVLLDEGVILDKEIPFDVVGRNPLDIAFLGQDTNTIKETVADEIEYAKEKKFTHVLPFADFTQWALEKEELGKLGIKVIVNSFESIRTVNDYFEIYKECRENGIIHPKTYRGHSGINYFPLVIKSRDKKDFYFAKNMRDVYNFTSDRKDVLVQQYFHGLTSKVVFIRDWMVGVWCLSDYIMKIKEKCPVDTQRIIELFGLDFGTLDFVTNSGVEYFIDVKPYIEWEFLGAENFVLMNLLGENRPSSFIPGDKIIKIPSVLKEK